MNILRAKFVIVTAVLLFLLIEDTASLWRSRRRRRRRCPWRACRWGGWGAWTTCSASCGNHGTQRRWRGIAVSAACGGPGCSGPSSQTQACNRRCCPRSCRWHNWSSWSACTATCGSSGIRSRTRGNTPAYCGGSGCGGSSSQVQACNRQCCPVNCQWSSWGSWSSCSASCGSGTQTRTRSIAVSASCAGRACDGGTSERKSCHGGCCPRNCQWHNWSTWSACTASCGNSGTRSRTRGKTAEYCGGSQCSGDGDQVEACNRGCCPQNCRWLSWGSWGTCTHQCGNTGTRERTRTTEAATCGGRECTGDNSETSPCNRYCPNGSPNGPGCNCAGTGYNGTCCDNDIDECATGVHSCHQHATCTNTVGSYRCTCNSGYTGDGRTCTALCWGSTTCPRGGICSSPNRCTSCDSGYESPDCGNIDECATDTDNCHEDASCTDTDGSFTCTCNDGYIGNGLHCERNAPNLVSCPADTHITVNSPDGSLLDWTDPEFRFQPSNELANHECSANKGDAAPIGTHNVQCWAEGFADGTTCDFDVIVEAPECVVPPRPLNGAVTCGVAEGAQKYCSVSCQDSHDFAEKPADAYRCDWNATWHPAEDLPWPDCSRSYRPGRARQKNELYYYSGSCAVNQEDIKTDLLRLYATLGDCSAGIRCGISDIEVTCELNSRKRRDTPRDTELREQSVEFVAKRSALGNTIKLEFMTEAESLAEEPTATDQSDVVGALDNMYFEIRARVAARNFNLEVGGESLEPVNYVGLLPTFDIHCEEGQIERIETFGAVCINCPVHTHYQDNTCLPCPPGWYQVEEAQTECKVCPSSGNLPEGCEEEPDHCHFNPCLNGGTCNDFVGFHNCTCPDSFTGIDCEEDVDECAQGIDLCHEAATCTNTHRGYNCTCNDGYTGDGYTCIGNDECEDGTDTCDEHATCTNTAGGYTCGCNQGYDGDGFTCAEIDECDGETDTCHEDATCTNTPGSYTCVCNQGYHGDGNICTDVNECEEGTDTCDGQATCTNTPGGYTCECNDGYSGNGSTCTDIHECDDGTHTCDEHATCTNTPGGHTCACNQGYDGDGFTCIEINECDGETDTCHEDATCTNTPGSFTCACNQGYHGNGFTCTDEDECALQTDTCDEHATCTNTPGGYKCACLEGFSGDGYTCKDDDECGQESTCDEHATCTNTPGSYTCACNEGYTGNGNTCTERCSSDFQFWNDACYFLSPNRKTFVRAESDCDRREAKLVVVPDLETHQHLIQNAKSKRNIWIGLSDRGREGAFFWSDGNRLGSFHPWRGRNNPRTDCVAMMRFGRTYKWKVKRCGAKINYFCQKTAATNP